MFQLITLAIVPCVHVHNLFLPLVFTSLWHVLFTSSLSVQNIPQMFKKDLHSDYVKKKVKRKEYNINEHRI